MFKSNRRCFPRGVAGTWDQAKGTGGPFWRPLILHVGMVDPKLGGRLPHVGFENVGEGRQVGKATVSGDLFDGGTCGN